MTAQMTQQINAVLPLLIIALAITLMLLLIAVKRSQRMVHGFTITTLVLSIIATVQLMPTTSIQVTPLILVEQYGLLALLLILLASLMVVSLSLAELKQGVEVHDEYYLLILLVVLGAGVLVVSDHYATVFLGFELLSIALVGLVGYQREQEVAVEVGFKYLILSATASSVMLLGIAFIYSQTGSLSLTMPTGGSEALNEQTQAFYFIGLTLFIIGIAFKLSLAPLHLWTPDVYQGSPTLITMLMATVSKVAMALVLLKVLLAPAIQQVSTPVLEQVVVSLAILSMLVGNLLALKQQNIKRLLAYSSIAHMGYLLVVTILLHQYYLDLAWQSAIFYLSTYVLATLSLFYVISKMPNLNGCQQEQLTISDWQGMFWQHRGLAVLVLLSLLSLAGIPLTAGFIGKFYLISHVTVHQNWWLLTSLIVGSGIGLFYYLRLAITLFAAQLDSEAYNQDTSYSLTLVSLLVFIGLTVGVLPDTLMQFIAMK